MRSFALIFLFIGLVGIAFAQVEKPITEWSYIDLPEDEFSVDAPERFKLERPPFQLIKKHVRGEFHSDNERFYLFIDAPKEQHQRKQVEAFLSYSNQTASYFNITGYDAAKAEFEDPTGFYHRIIFAETASRVFTLHTISQSKDAGDAVRFLNSFRLQPKPVADSAPLQQPFVVDSKSEAELTLETAALVPSQAAGRGSGIGAGSGQGSGVGTGSGSGSGTGSGTSTPPTPTKITTPLRISYKHKAGYTDFARFYSIQGTVTLRVTFLASGEIGSVTTIKKLPFGLTESAIYAAKQMRFEPETVDGVARTTTRPVSFTFNIY